MQDLLCPAKDTYLTLHEGIGGVVFVDGVKEAVVKNIEECLGCLQTGERNRY